MATDVASPDTPDPFSTLMRTELGRMLDGGPGRGAGTSWRKRLSVSSAAGSCSFRTAAPPICTGSAGSVSMSTASGDRDRNRLPSLSMSPSENLASIWRSFTADPSSWLAVTGLRTASAGEKVTLANDSGNLRRPNCALIAMS